MFITTIMSVVSGYATTFLNLMANIYPGYQISITGSFIGLIYGFLDIFIGIYLINWVYKKISK